MGKTYCFNLYFLINGVEYSLYVCIFIIHFSAIFFFAFLVVCLFNLVKRSLTVKDINLLLVKYVTSIFSHLECTF